MIYDVVVKTVLQWSRKIMAIVVKRLWTFNKLNSFGSEGFPFCNLIKNGNKIFQKKIQLFGLWLIE